MECFDRRADAYEANAPVQALAARRLADWISPQERRGNAVELGAGTGLLTRALQPWAGSFLATDAAPRMVAQGRRNVPQADWTHMDARDARIPGDTDWIFSASMLQWLDDPVAALADWRRQAPRAQLAVSVFVAGTLAELEDVLPGHAPLTWRPDAFWLDALDKAGWRVERHETETALSRHADPLELLRTLRAFGGTAHRARVAPARLRAALDQYRGRHRLPEGGCPATWRTFRALARA